MAIRIPQNKIKYQYTIGKEYMYENNYKEYQGYYYKLNGKIFAGNEFNSNAPTLIKISSEKINSLLTKASTYVYGRISKSKVLNNTISSIPKSDTNSLYDKGGELFLHFYYSKMKQQPIIIKEINEDTYKSLQTNPLYTTTYIGTYNNKIQTPDDAEKQIPGIKDFLGL